MPRIALVIGLLFIGLSVSAQRYFHLSGVVMDSLGQPAPGVRLQVKNFELGTNASSQGQYKFRLEEGYYTIVVSGLGFESYQFDITLKQDVKRNVVLVPSTNNLKDFVVSNKQKDPGPDIIRKAILAKSKWKNQVNGYSCQVYILASDKSKNDFKIKGLPEDGSGDSVLALLDTNKTSYSSLVECHYTYHRQGPKTREFKDAGRYIGNTPFLYYLRPSAGDFDFYQNIISVASLGDNAFVSPLHDWLAFSTYKFQLQGSWYDSTGLKIYRIKVTPRITGNATFSGIIEIADSSYRIYSLDLEVKASKLVEYDKFSIQQQFKPLNDSLWMLSKMLFTYSDKVGRNVTKGQTLVVYRDYTINPVFEKKFFGSELGTTLDSAYERDSAYWDSVRLEPLSVEQLRLIQTTDSIKEAHSKKEYLDSIDAVTNRVKLLNLLWYGQSHVNRKNETFWNFPALPQTFLAASPGGARIVLWTSYWHRFKSKRTIALNPNVNWGIRNRDWKGSFSGNFLYNPFKRAIFSLSFGRSFELIYQRDAWVNLFKRSNFFEQDYLNLGHDFELVNGLYLSTTASYSKRRSIDGYKFGELSNDVFGKTNNQIVNFNPYTALTTLVELRYVPFQQYIREPRQKVVLGSKWPTLTLDWRQGISGIAGSTVKFTYIEWSVTQKINFGVIGVSQFRIRSGKFFDTTALPYVDRKIQRRGDPFLFTSPLNTFQLLGKTFPTYNWFWEGHYLHRFNGFFTNKIPIFKKLNLNEVAGAGFLIAPEVHMLHSEVFVGAERVFKMGKYRFRLGAYYANGLSNTSFSGHGFKFSLELYDVVRNTWNF